MSQDNRILLDRRTHEEAENVSILRDQLDGRQHDPGSGLTVQKRDRPDHRKSRKARRKPEAQVEVLQQDPDDDGDDDGYDYRRHRFLNFLFDRELLPGMFWPD